MYDAWCVKHRKELRTTQTWSLSYFKVITPILYRLHGVSMLKWQPSIHSLHARYVYAVNENGVNGSTAPSSAIHDMVSLVVCAISQVRAQCGHVFWAAHILPTYAYWNLRWVNRPILTITVACIAMVCFLDKQIIIKTACSLTGDSTTACKSHAGVMCCKNLQLMHLEYKRLHL